MSNVRVIETTATVTLSNVEWKQILCLLYPALGGVYARDVRESLASAIEEQTGVTL
jgi:hypothetical protein